ncbi:DUF2141 domain-containing protein [Caulobacter sp. NIBR2454]|uniref:DUF2141 domain-containing protein n=1 Tax=Caulobacter sp. NIBR2454 TaxID=3015996 RepID=UPI0022B641D1|nr:DUF2141 domain-containing protein [Caulobacter sp. NIBR2454]
MKARTLLLGVAVAAAAVTTGSSAFAQACEGTGSARLTVHVAGVRAAKGEIAVTVYPDDRKRFLAPKGKLYRIRAATTAPVTTVCFNVQPGAYAVAIYHDWNGDRDFNRSVIGMPTEGFGFSNDAPTKVGLPSFEAVRFVVRGDTAIRSTLRYLK